MTRVVVLKNNEFLHTSPGVQIATTVKKLDIYDNLIIDGKYYNVCQSSCINHLVGVKEYTPIDEDETYESEFTCPYCGCVNYDAFEFVDEGETTCGQCGAELEYQREVEITYKVNLVNKPKIIELKSEG